MQKTAQTLMVLAAFLFMVGTAPLPAFQQPEPPAQEQQPAEQEKATEMAQGELVRVDADTKTLVIRSADETELQFTYSDATEVTGAQTGTAGLATATGAQVIVHFTSDGATRSATKIEVQPAQDAPPAAQPEEQQPPQ